MGILKKLFAKGSASGVKSPFLSTLIQRFNSQIGLNSTKGLYEYKNWVYACVSSRSEAVGDIELYLCNRKTGEKIEDHELFNLIYKPNSLTTKYELFEATQAFKDLDGNAFWYLAKDQKGVIREIYSIRPDRMSIVTDKENALKIVGYVYKGGDGQMIPFEPTDILHFKSFNPLGNHPMPHRGMGIVEAASWSIDTDNEIREWNYNFFKNSARPDGILYSDGGAVDQTDYNRLSAQWKQEHQGSENVGKIAILSGGIKWQEITRSQKDMDFVNQRTFSRDEILSLFKVPKSVLGITDDVNRANAEASIYVFALRTIKPSMQRIVDILNEFLVPLFDENLEFRFVSPVPADRIQVTNEYTMGINKWLSRNEIRAREGLPPTENGDEFTGSQFEGVIDTVPKTKKIKAVKETKKAVADKGNKTIAEKAIEAFVAKMPIAKEVDKKTAYVDGWKKRIDTNTSPLKKKLDAYFLKQRDEVIKNLKNEMKGLETPEYSLKAVDDMLFDMDNAVSAGISLITPFIRQYLIESGKVAGAYVDSEFDSTTSNIDKFIADRAKYFANEVNETTYDDVYKAIKEGIDDGDDLASLSERVSNVYDKAIDYRTDMIARTEVSASANFGAIEAYEQAGIEKLEWKVVNPQDEDCLMNEGVEVKLGQPFPSGNEYPPVHPNCECTTLPVFED